MTLDLHCSCTSPHSICSLPLATGASFPARSSRRLPHDGCRSLKDGFRASFLFLLSFSLPRLVPHTLLLASHPLPTMRFILPLVFVSTLFCGASAGRSKPQRLDSRQSACFISGDATLPAEVANGIADLARVVTCDGSVCPASLQPRSR